jgi:hypothetical protein
MIYKCKWRDGPIQGKSVDGFAEIDVGRGSTWSESPPRPVDLELKGAGLLGSREDLELRRPLAAAQAPQLFLQMPQFPHAARLAGAKRYQVGNLAAPLAARWGNAGADGR